MSQEIDIKAVQQKLYEKLKPSGWGEKLKLFILSHEFTVILETLMDESKNGTKFTPVIKYLFRAFEECPYDKLKVVMVGQDPYPYAGVADGIGFSCSRTPKPEASLKFIHKEIKDTVYPDSEYTPQNDLVYLSNQGILMLNTALTTSIGEVGTHLMLWRPFISFLFDTLAFDKSQIAYVFMGAKAKAWAKSVPQNNFKFFTTHPASSGYNKKDRWDSGDLFNQLGALVEENLETKIIW
jgi:uracil-DNA glycosylase